MIGIIWGLPPELSDVEAKMIDACWSGALAAGEQFDVSWNTMERTTVMPTVNINAEEIASLDEGYGYYWFRHHEDGSTFIACRDEEDGLWFMPGIGVPILDIESSATLLGPVPRTVVGGGSIDQ